MKLADLINRYLVKPLLEEKPRSLSEKEWLSYIFHTKTRQISTYKVKEPCKMRGVFLVGGMHPDPDMKAQAAKGDALTVRYDESIEELIVEHKSGCWKLDKNQWELLKLHIKLVRGNEEI